MQRAVQGDGGALETLEVLIVGDQLPVGAPEGFPGADEAFPEGLCRADGLAYQVEDSGRHRAIGGAEQPAEMLSGVIETGGTELRVEIAAEGLSVRHRAEKRWRQVEGETELW